MIHLGNLSLSESKAKEPYEFWIDGLDKDIGASLKEISMNGIVESQRLKIKEEDRVLNKAEAGEALDTAEAYLLYGEIQSSMRCGQWEVDFGKWMHGLWYLERVEFAMNKIRTQHETVDAAVAK